MEFAAAATLAAELTREGAALGFAAAVEGERIVFKGGPYGPHSLDIGVSERGRVLAHFNGYIGWMKPAVLAEKPACFTVAPPAPPAPAPAARVAPKVGDRVRFCRGMYGSWEGRVVKLYTSRGNWHRAGGEPWCVVRFKMANGGVTEKRCPVERVTVIAK